MRYSAVAVILGMLSAVAGCGRSGEDADNPQSGSFADSSSGAKEALSAPVSFQLTEENFARWEVAERNLEGIPESDFTSPPRSGSAVDRAVARLESSARARRAIGSAGLSVRDFVLETVALAQAVEASRTGRAAVGSGVAAGNFAFVERFRDRIRRAGLGAELSRETGDSAITDPNTAAELAAANADRRAEMAARRRDSAAGSDGRALEEGAPRDSSRDTLRDSLDRRPR